MSCHKRGRALRSRSQLSLGRVGPGLLVSLVAVLASGVGVATAASGAAARAKLPSWLAARPGWGPGEIGASLPTYSGSGSVGFELYNGTVPHWYQHDVPDIKACLATYAPHVKFYVSDPKGSAQLQTTQVQAMLTKGINALIVAPATLTPSAIVDAANRDKVPVIAYASPVVGFKPGQIAALVGDGPTEIGTAQAKWILAQHYPHGAQIGMINGDLATQYAVLMQQSSLKVLKPALKSGALKLVYNQGAVNWDESNAEKLASAMITAHPHVRAVIAGADFLAAGVVEALKTAKLAGKVDIIGLDGDPIGLQNMLLGYQKATVIKSSDNEAAVGCAGALYELMKKPLPKSIFNATWKYQTAPEPFRDTPIQTIGKSQVSLALKWHILTKSQLCAGLKKGVSPLCP